MKFTSWCIHAVFPVVAKLGQACLRLIARRQFNRLGRVTSNPTKSYISYLPLQRDQLLQGWQAPIISLSQFHQVPPMFELAHKHGDTLLRILCVDWTRYFRVSQYQGEIDLNFHFIVHIKLNCDIEVKEQYELGAKHAEGQRTWVDYALFLGSSSNHYGDQLVFTYMKYQMHIVWSLVSPACFSSLCNLPPGIARVSGVTVLLPVIANVNQRFMNSVKSIFRWMMWTQMYCPSNQFWTFKRKVILELGTQNSLSLVLNIFYLSDAFIGIWPSPFKGIKQS